MRSLADQVKKDIQEEKKWKQVKCPKKKNYERNNQIQGGWRSPLFLVNVLNLILFKGYYYC